MGFLGLDFLESRETRKIKDDAYNKLYFPYGNHQKDIIIEVLRMYNNIPSEEIIYNFIVTKQELMKKDLKDIDEKEFKQLVSRLSNSFITKDISTLPYIILADEDIHIDSNLNYSSVDVLNEKIDKIKAWL